jgi:hypothetical protein
MMKKKIKGIVKGAPSGLVISLLVHAAAFMIAGLLVVFSVVKKEEISFVPPPSIERPKMRLKKPKVKVKKTAKPASPTRIMAKVNKADMPDIQLPELGGAGNGFGGIGGLGDGFGLMPDLGEMTLFGGGVSIGNDFVGTFYDMKRGRQGRTIPYARDTFKHVVKQFMVKGWKPSAWSKFYRSPNKMYATNFMIPPIPASMAPEAFGVTDCVACCWIVHYKGQLVYPEDIKIRFRGQGDEILAVRVDGEVNLIACWPRGNTSVASYFDSLWSTSESDSLRYPLGNNYAVIGDWIELKAGEPLDMEVIAGEVSGGVFTLMLCVEVEGKEYPTNPYLLGPTLPMFKTEEPTLTMAEEIWNRLDPGDATVTNGPVFRDYKTKSRSVAGPVEPEQKDSEPDEEDALRLWTLKDGKTFEAEFLTKMADYIVVKTSGGKQQKIPFARLSEADQLYADLASPPEFNLDYSRKSEQIDAPDNGPFLNNNRPMNLSEYTFGVKIKQKSSGKYNYPVTVEYFAIGEEVDGDNYILLARESDTFTPIEENNKSHEFYGNPVRVDRMATRASAPLRGCKYGGFLITMTDARGKIIQHKTSSDFLFDILEDLKKLPISRHFNREGQRVPPPRPTVMDRPDWMRNE